MSHNIAVDTHPTQPSGTLQPQPWRFVISVILAILAGGALGSGALVLGFLGLMGCQTAECGNIVLPIILAIAAVMTAGPLAFVLLIALLLHLRRVALATRTQPAWRWLAGAIVLATIAGLFLGLGVTICTFLFFPGGMSLGSNSLLSILLATAAITVLLVIGYFLFLRRSIARREEG
jgi:hypothetical protein